jgi:WD40 repeat protein
MSKRTFRLLAKLTLGVLILAAVAGVVRSRQPPPHLTARVALQGSEGYIHAGFSPDGRTFAGASIHTNEDRSTHWAGPLCLWDTITGQVRATFGDDLKACWPPAQFSPDGKVLVIEGQGVFKVWDVETGRERTSLDLGKNRYLWDGNFAFSPDGTTLAVGSAGTRSVRLLDPAAGTVRATLEGVFPPVRFSPDGGTLAVASDQGIELWDVAAARQKSVLPGKDLHVRSLAFAPDGKALAAGTVRGPDEEKGTSEVRIWDVAAGTESALLFVPKPGVRLLYSRDGTVLLAWDPNLALLAWDVTAAPPRALPAVPTGPIWQPAADGKTLVERTATGIRVWDVVAGKEKADLWAPTCRGMDWPALSPDGRHVYVQTSQWEGQGGLSQLFGGGGAAPPASANGGAPPILDAARLLDFSTGRILATLDGAGHGEFSPDGRLIAAGYRDTGIRVWDVPADAGDHGLGLSATALAVLLAVAGGWWLVGRVWERFS